MLERNGFVKIGEQTSWDHGAGKEVLEVRLGATTVIVVDAGRVVATHTRSLHKGTEDLILDHYLEVLARKPGWPRRRGHPAVRTRSHPTTPPKDGT